MSLLALLFALACERGLTHLLHLREWRWLDPLLRLGRRAWLGARPARRSCSAALSADRAAGAAGGCVARALARPHLLGLLQFAFAVFVLLFAFGPRDLKDEVDDYVAALERGDRDEAAAPRQGTARVEPPARGARRCATRSRKRSSSRPTTASSA